MLFTRVGRVVKNSGREKTTKKMFSLDTFRLELFGKLIYTLILTLGDAVES